MSKTYPLVAPTRKGLLWSLVKLLISLLVLFGILALLLMESNRQQGEHDGTKLTEDFQVESVQGTTVSLVRYGVPYSVAIRNPQGLKRPLAGQVFFIALHPAGEMRMCRMRSDGEPCYKLIQDANGPLAMLLASAKTNGEHAAEWARHDAEGRFPRD